MTGLTEEMTTVTADRTYVKQVIILISIIRSVLKNSQENTCARVSFLMKFADLQSLTLLKNKFRRQCFLVNFVKFLITPFLKNPSDCCFCNNTGSV